MVRLKIYHKKKNNLLKLLILLSDEALRFSLGYKVIDNENVTIDSLEKI